MGMGRFDKSFFVMGVGTGWFGKSFSFMGRRGRDGLISHSLLWGGDGGLISHSLVWRRGRDSFDKFSVMGWWTKGFDKSFSAVGKVEGMV